MEKKRSKKVTAETSVAFKPLAIPTEALSVAKVRAISSSRYAIDGVHVCYDGSDSAFVEATDGRVLVRVDFKVPKNTFAKCDRVLKGDPRIVDRRFVDLGLSEPPPFHEKPFPFVDQTVLPPFVIKGVQEIRFDARLLAKVLSAMSECCDPDDRCVVRFQISGAEKKMRIDVVAGHGRPITGIAASVCPMQS